MSAAAVEEVFEKIEPASMVGELFKQSVLEEMKGQRPHEEKIIIVLGEDGQRLDFYVKHTKTEGLDEFGKKVMKEDFVLVALLPTTLKAIVIDLRKKAPE